MLCHQTTPKILKYPQPKKIRKLKTLKEPLFKILTKPGAGAPGAAQLGAPVFCAATARARCHVEVLEGSLEVILVL